MEVTKWVRVGAEIVVPIVRRLVRKLGEENKKVRAELKTKKLVRDLRK